MGGDQARPAGQVSPDARAIAGELTTRRISLSLGGSVYDPTNAVGRLPFNILAMVAEFSDLIRLRTREGMKVHGGEYSTAKVAELFGVGRSTV